MRVSRAHLSFHIVRAALHLDLNTSRFPYCVAVMVFLPGIHALNAYRFTGQLISLARLGLSAHLLKTRQKGHFGSAWARASSHEAIQEPERKQKPRWSEQEDNIVLRGYADGKSAYELEKELPGRTKGTIWARWEKIKVAIEPRTTLRPRRWQRWTKIQREMLVDLSSKGLPAADVANKLGRTVESVRGMLTRLIPDVGERKELNTRSRRTYTPDESTLLLSLRSQGVPIKAMAHQLGRSLGSVKIHLSRKNPQSEPTSRARYRPNSPKEINRVLALLQEHKTLEEIAQVTGTDSDHVRKLQSRYRNLISERSGTVRISSRWSDHDVQRALSLRAQGESLERIGVILHRSKEGVRSKLDALRAARKEQGRT